MELWLAQNGNSLDNVQIKGSKSLRVLCLAGYILVSVPASAEDTMYDKFLPQFQDIVDLASPLANPQAATNARPNSVFSHEVGILPSLYTTGTKCRDPSIRRRALQLLASSRRKGGVWDSRQAAKVVQRVVALEEDGISAHERADLPERCRIRDTWVQPASSTDRPTPREPRSYRVS
jgi:hypothetical protein